MTNLSMAKRFVSPKILKFIVAIVAIINVFYITALLLDSNTSKKLTDKFKSNWDNLSSGSVSISNKATQSNSKQNKELPKVQTVDEKVDSSITRELYPVPDKPYDKLSDHDKILYKLNEVTKDKSKYWLGHTELTDYELQIRVKDFLPENWVNKPTLFYDPRFTLSVYLSEIKHQYLKKNPENVRGKSHEIVVPFSWADWVDLTMLNDELLKPEHERKNCEYMKAVHHIPAKDPNYCINNQDISQQDLEEMNLPSTDYIPGFAVKKSPTNKASNEVRMWEGKSHLLTYAANPLAIIFLSKDGVYEAQIDGKQRIVDGELFTNYLKNNKIAKTQDESATLILNPVNEFNSLLEHVAPNPLDPEEDEYGMVAMIKQTDPTKPRDLYLPESAFNYQQDKIDVQIAQYESRMSQLRDLTTNELSYDQSKINAIRFTRNEKIYFDGLKFANKYQLNNEPTYFRMARLNFGNEENESDAGWHYEWRFFNGALRYLKKGWNQEELLIREKVLLDRILRNWFRFANEKGIVSWISHGPLLSWYWDGLLFPFDEDIDIQMPAEELSRFSKLYNQTLVVEDITEGFGKYFIDCSTFIHHRGKSYKENHIDARFIDIDTGSYIDITGLGISDEKYPDKYKELVESAEREGRAKPVYNCRNLHFYSYDELSPLRFTMMGGVPLYVPNRIEDILNDEYSKGLTSYEYGGFYFVDAINLWIHHSKLEFLFPYETFKTSDGKINELRFTQLVQGIGEKEVIKLLENDEDILLEYYLTKNVTDIHKEELTYLFNTPNGANTKLKDVGHQKTNGEIADNKEYHKFTSKFKFQKPFRRPLFNYEMIDKPRHHQE